MTELEDLQAKLAARKGRAGYEASVAEIERRIDVIERKQVRYRSAETGLFVSEAFALENPRTTVKERRE